MIRNDNKIILWKAVLLTIILIISIYNHAYSQEKNALGEAFSFGTDVTGDFVINFKGGIKEGHTYIGMESLTLEFTTEQANFWKGGTLFIHALNTHGAGSSETLAGDHQVFSNIESGDYTGLYEYWYQQQFGNFSVLFGQHDLNSEFGGTKYGGLYINSSFGIAPSISLNVPVSIYPVAAPCVFLKYESSNHLYYKLAVYDGDPGNFETNRYNLEWSISPKQGFLTIGELNYNRFKNETLTGIYKIGAYYHSGEFENYADTLNPIQGNYGFYFVADQALFARSLHAGRGLCFFIQASYAPPKNNFVEYYIGGGLRYHGVLPSRYYDELGIAFAHISLSNYYLNVNPGALNYETAIELTYKFHFGSRYSIQPSMQYIINPGTDNQTSNCLVGLLRFSLSY